MENKKTKCVLVMASRFDGEIQFSPNLWNSEKEAISVFVETWIESHYLLKVITLSHEDRTDFEQEAQESDRELKKVFNDMFLTAQIQELQNELKSVAESGVLSEGEIAGIMNSKELENYTYDCYDFSGSKWGELMGNPGKKFHLMVFGRPKQGKSIFCVQFANYLSREHGKVLYIASEEGFSATLQKKIREFGMSNPNLDFANFREYEQIRQALRGRNYKFVFIDSVNFIKITPEQVEALKAENPGAAFITVQQATKGGQFRGSQEFAHNCDMIVEVIAGQANHQGRYAGHTEMAIFDGPEQKEQPKETEETNGRLEVSEISPEYGQMELF